MMSSVFVFLLTVSFLATPSSSATTSFVFGGCSQQKYLPGSPYESKVNSVLTSLGNSAMFSTYNNFTFPGSSSAGSQDTLYGLFQCRGDLSSNDCSQCVARAASQLGTLCVNSCGGALQLEGCLVKYDNSKFLGVEDKTLVVKKCGPSNGFDSDALTDLEAVLANLGTGDGTYKPYRVSGSGNVRGVAQCVGDLSPSECQDCLSGAVGQLRSGCGTSSWGDIFLAKCYARYLEGGYNSNDGHDHDDDDNNDDLDKTLAILIGIVAAAALLTVFIHHFWKKLDRDEKEPESEQHRDPMALEWVVLGYAAAAEAIMVLLLTIPGLDGLRKGLVTVTRNLLKPFLSVVPFCLFLLMDIYWKYETRPSCHGDSCTPSEHLRHQKSIMKSQRNALLIAAALIFYWLLYTVTHLVVRIEQLNQRRNSLPEWPEMDTWNTTTRKRYGSRCSMPEEQTMRIRPLPSILNEATELPTHVVHMLPFNRNLDGMNENLTAGGESAKKISLSS
ncbi:hypothetical protein ACFX13_011122 [Malus domestica]